jgi:hypothetical protein
MKGLPRGALHCPNRLWPQRSAWSPPHSSRKCAQVDVFFNSSFQWSFSCEGKRREHSARKWAGAITSLKPLLDGSTFIHMAIMSGDRVLHDLQCHWTFETLRLGAKHVSANRPPSATLVVPDA